QMHEEGGTANGGDDTSAAQTVTSNVTTGNDSPSFTKGSDQTVLEDAGVQSVSNWATAISAGPANESSQALNFLVTNTNSALFLVIGRASCRGRVVFVGGGDAHRERTGKT